MRGSWVWIETKDAAADASITFDLPVGYDVYRIDMVSMIVGTDSKILNCRFSDDAGATFEADASDYSWMYQGGRITAPATYTVTDTADAADSEITIANNCGTTGTESQSMETVIWNALEAATPTHIIWQLAHRQTTNLWSMKTGSGEVFVAAANDAVQYIMSSGNIASGRFVLTGLVST